MYLTPKQQEDYARLKKAHLVERGNLFNQLSPILTPDDLTTTILELMILQKDVEFYLFRCEYEVERAIEALEALRFFVNNLWNLIFSANTPVDDFVSDTTDEEDYESLVDRVMSAHYREYGKTEHWND
jgi:hypothetical protein